MADTPISPAEFFGKPNTAEVQPAGITEQSAPTPTVPDPTDFFSKSAEPAPMPQPSEAAPATTAGTVEDPATFFGGGASTPQVQPSHGNKYLEDDMVQNPELVDALSRYYAAKKANLTTPAQLVDQYIADMRWADNNTLFAGKMLMDIKGAKERGDMQYIQDLKTMRENWNRKSSVFSEDSFGGIASGIAGNVVRGLIDPTSLLYLVPGLASGKIAISGGQKFAIGMALDAGINAGMDLATQKAQQELSIQGDISGKEVLQSGALGMVPGLVIKGGQKVFTAGRVLMDAVSPNVGLDGRPVPQAYLNRIRSEAEASDATNRFHIQHTDSGKVPVVLRKTSDIQEIFPDAATGEPMVFPDAQSAGQWAVNNFNNLGGSQANVTPQQITRMTKNPASFFSNPKNPTDWHVSEYRFPDQDAADKFIKERGSILGSTDKKDYNYFNGDVYTPNTFWGRLKANSDMFVQRYINDGLTYDKAVEEGWDRIKKNNTQGQFNALLSDNPSDMRTNGQNSNAIAASFMAYKPMALVPDPNNPYARMYDVIPGEKSLLDIMNNAHEAIKAGTGIDDYNGVQKEAFRYALGKRILQIEGGMSRSQAHPQGIAAKPTGIKLSEVRDFLGAVQADPVRYQAYEQAASDLDRFNEHYIKFMVDHDVMSTEAAVRELTTGHYLPMVRLYDGSDMFFNPKKGSAANTIRKGISDKDKLRGQQLLDPLEAYANHVSAGIRAAVDNRSSLRFYDWARAAGPGFMNQYAEKVSTPVTRQMVSIANVQKALENALGPQAVNIQVTPQNVQTLSLWVRKSLLSSDPTMDFVLRNGEPEFYKINNPLLYDYVKGSGFDAVNSMLRAADDMDAYKSAIKGWVWFNNWFAKAWVINPMWNTFKALPADAFTGWLFKAEAASSIKSNLLDVPFINAMNGLRKSMGDDDYIRHVTNGALMSGLHANLGSAKNKMIESAAKMGIDVTKLAGLGYDKDVTLWRRFNTALFHNTGLEAWSNRVESAVRRNTADTYLNDGYTRAEASRAGAENTIDFRMQGTDREAMAKQRAIASFTRPMINGLYQAGIKYLPLPGAYNISGKQRAVYWSKLIVATALPTAVYEILGAKDPYYEQLTDKYKDRWFMVPWNGVDGKNGYLTIPKYPEQGFLSNLTRYYFQELRKSEEGRTMWGLMSGHIWDSLEVAARFDDPTGNLPAPIAAFLNINTNTQGGHNLMPQSQTKLSPENQGDIRSMGGYRFMDSPEARDLIFDFNQRMGTELTPGDIPVLVNGFFSGLTQYIMGVIDFSYKNSKGIYEFDPYSMPFVKNLYNPAHPVRFTSYEQRMDEYEKRIETVANDLNAAKGQAKIYGLDKAMEKLNGEDKTKYQKYLVAGAIIQDARKERDKHMQDILKFYNLHQQDMPTVKFDRALDTMFAAKNQAIEPMIKRATEVLKADTSLEKQTKNAKRR